MQGNKYLIFVVLFSSVGIFSCRSTREIKKVVAPVDSSLITKIVDHSYEDSLKRVDSVIKEFKKNHIQFNSFSAKIKVDVETSSGKQPDLVAQVRIIKDSAIWISISSTFLNIEVYRVLIKKDSVILLNKQDKEVQYRSLDYLQEVTAIPFDYKTLEDLLIGNPIFYSDSLVSFEKREKQILFSTRSDIFKNLITISKDNALMLHSKLDDLDIARHRTADLTYSDYVLKSGFYFAEGRQVIVTEKNNIDIKLVYKQYEFNKELSVGLTVPRNYKRK